MTLERTSLGWYDSDDDGVRDISSIPKIEKYKLQHFVPGDTFKIKMKGPSSQTYREARLPLLPLKKV